MAKMTPNEALHEISTKVFRNTDDFEMRISKDCYKEIVKALKKQIPKKIDINKYIYTKCDCGYEFSVHFGDGYYDVPIEIQTKHCPDCGQALDWSDTE